MNESAKASIEAFLSGLASRTATPGGGAATALTGAVACALAEMVVAWSIKPASPDAHPALESAAAALHDVRTRLLRLVDEDQQAYQQLTAARRDRRRGDSSADPSLSATYQSAVRAAAHVPAQIANGMVQALAQVDAVADNLNPHLRTDLDCAAELALACVRSCRGFVMINAADIEDADVAAELTRRIDNHLDRAATLAGHLQERPPSQ